MLGKPEWFARRKYLGWGITPKTWQGWVYVLAIVSPFIIAQSFFNWRDKTRVIATALWLIIVIADVVDIMIHMKKDEREKIHEAIAERNAFWAIMTVLVIGLVYQIAQSVSLESQPTIDPLIAIALGAALITKAITNFYLDKKD